MNENDASPPNEDNESVSNSCWDELNQLYRHCVTMMSSSRPIVDALKDQQTVDNCRDKEELLNQAKILQKDLSDYNGFLQEIHDQHKDKEGGTDDPNEIMTAVNVGEMYQQWITSYQSVVIPTIQSLTDNIHNGQTEKNEKENDNSQQATH